MYGKATDQDLAGRSQPETPTPLTAIVAGGKRIQVSRKKRPQHKGMLRKS